MISEVQLYFDDLYLCGFLLLSVLIFKHLFSARQYFSVLLLSAKRK